MYYILSSFLYYIISGNVTMIIALPVRNLCFGAVAAVL